MAGSRSLVEVGISMVLRDGFSQQAGRISSSYAGLMNDMNQWNRAVTQSAGAAFDYGTQLVGGMYEAYKHSAQVNNQIFMTSKIAGATVAQSKELMDIAQQVNMETPLTNYDIASGMRYLAMAGNSADAIENMIRPASELASVFEMQLGGKGGVADMMTNIMATFGIASSDAKHVADVLGVATTSANMDLRDLAQSLQYSGATFRNAGIDLGTAAAAIGVLGDQGIQASSAGTALANMVRYLTLSITGQKAKGAKMLEAMGISRDELVDARGNLRDLGTLMSVLANKMGRLSGTAREAAFYNIFGVRGQRAASALMQALWNGSDKMQRIMDKEANADGWLDSIMGERRDTPQGRIDAFNASIDNLKTSLGQALSIFTPLITGVTKIANGLAAWAGKGGIGGFVVKLGGALAISFTLVSAIRLIHGVFRMVTGMAGLFSTSTAAAGTGMGRVLSTTASVEIHLQHMVALMAEYVGLSYQAGTRGMMLPGGGRLSRNRAGRVYVTSAGKNLSPATYAAGLGAAAGAGGRAAAGAVGGAVTKTGLKAGLSRFGGAALGFLGGPWGLALTLGLTAVSVGMDYLSSSTNSNTDALNNNTDALSAQERQNIYNERFATALEAAVKANSKDPTIHITINGSSAGAYQDGATIPIDEAGLFF